MSRWFLVIGKMIPRYLISPLFQRFTSYVNKRSCKALRYPYNAKERELQMIGCKIMKFSANQAADETGKNISTITRAIKSGKLSAHKNEDGSYSIDAAELFRVYGAKDCATPEMRKDATLQSNASNPQEMDDLRELAEDRKAQIEDLRRRLDEAEKRLDQERQEAREEREAIRAEREKFMLWLDHKPHASSSEREHPPEPEQSPRRRWWQRKKNTDVQPS